MIAEAVGYLETIRHLTPGATVRFPDVAWDEYEELVAQMGDAWPGYRVNYYKGSLEAMSPLPEHEDYKSFVQDLVRLLTFNLELDLETRGSTTYRQHQQDSGAEPDTSFYVQHAAAVIGKRKLDLTRDPPPDVILEIDLTHGSLHKFPLYAALGVPEIWRYDGRHAHFYHLRGTEYVGRPHSLAFPLLSAAILTQFLEESKTVGQTAALRAFRQWLREMLRQS